MSTGVPGWGAEDPSLSRADLHATPTRPPILALPVGGDDFHRALLEWSSALPIMDGDGDTLEAPVSAARISSRFGIRHDPVRGGMRAHLGIDIPDAMGAPVHAAAGGTVVFAGWSPGYGNLIQIDHGHGTETRYGHLSSIVVHSGEIVPQSAVIGLVGSTGRSTGPHLHFEVRHDGVAMNPLPLLGQAIFSISISSEAPPIAEQPHWGGFGQEGAALPQSRLR